MLKKIKSCMSSGSKNRNSLPASPPPSPSPPLRQRLVSILRSADDLSNVELLELQETLTRKLAELSMVTPSRFSADELRRKSQQDESAMYIEQLLIGRVPLDVQEEPEPKRRSSEQVKHDMSVSMDIALTGITKWNFDPFMIHNNTRKRPLSSSAFWILRNDNCISDLDLNEKKVLKFLTQIEDGYLDNPYHNRTHACDVLQKIYMILNFGNYLGGRVWSTEERFACYFAAIIHDFRHPGVTSLFLIDTHNHCAIKHNDRSVLENHHLSEAFQVLQEPDNNFVQHFSKPRYRSFREKVIELVLATDMTRHFEILNESIGDFQVKETSPPPSFLKTPRNEHRLRLNSLKIAMKAADLGHCAVTNKLHRRWVAALEEEFFRQGDMEQSLSIEISPLMNRFKQGLMKTQPEFFDIISLPLFTHLCSAFPGVKTYLDNCLKNRKHWSNIEDTTPDSSRPDALEKLGPKKHLIMSVSADDVTKQQTMIGNFTKVKYK